MLLQGPYLRDSENWVFFNMSYLQQLLANKAREVKEKKEVIDERVFRMSPTYKKRRKSLKKHLATWEGPVVIPVFMRQTPEVDTLNLENKPHTTAKALEKAGAAAIAVATDEVFYGATVEDMRSVRKNCQLPVIRFDMIIDTFQVTESKAMGADAVVVAAGVDRTESTFEELIAKCREEKVEPIVEIGDAGQVADLDDKILFVLVNRRNPETRELISDADLKAIRKAVPAGITVWVTGGIQGLEVLERMTKMGFDGCCVGENLMKDAAPAFVLETLVK